MIINFYRLIVPFSYIKEIIKYNKLKEIHIELNWNTYMYIMYINLLKIYFLEK